MILIIKLGAMGDVLRTTPLLRALEEDVTWVVDRESIPLLEGIPQIRRLVATAEADLLRDERFTRVYNFDEDRRACLLAERMSAPVKKGFRWRDDGHVPFDSDAEYAWRLSREDPLKFFANRKTYQQVLFETAGLRWKGEDYLLGLHPSSPERHEVGINYLVGEKFRTKHWPHWNAFRRRPGISIQKRHRRLDDYVEWIQSCRVVVTSDSLGMHLALALRKRVVALFGSTSWTEIEMYGRGVKVIAEAPCSPCYKAKCPQPFYCMDWIEPRIVEAAIERVRAARPPIEERWIVRP